MHIYGKYLLPAVPTLGKKTEKTSNYFELSVASDGVIGVIVSADMNIDNMHEHQTMP